MRPAEIMAGRLSVAPGRSSDCKVSRPEKETVRSPCAVAVDSHDVPCSANPQSNGELRIWEINSGKFPTTQEKPMLVADATEIAADDLTAGIDPRHIR